MTVITFHVPPDVPSILKMSEQDFTREAQVLLAVKLFELGKLTSGKAAEIADMPRITFLQLLDRYRVPAINLQDEEIDHEIEAAKKLIP